MSVKRFGGAREHKIKSKYEDVRKNMNARENIDTRVKILIHT